jgi:hypothetical protein
MYVGKQVSQSVSRMVEHSVWKHSNVVRRLLGLAKVEVTEG